MCFAHMRSTTTRSERICHWPRTHRWRDPSRPSEALSRCRSSADCITIMCGSDLRQRHPALAYPAEAMALTHGLAQSGFLVDRNLAFEAHAADGQNERLPRLVAEL